MLLFIALACKRSAHLQLNSYWKHENLVLYSLKDKHFLRAHSLRVPFHPFYLLHMVGDWRAVKVCFLFVEVANFYQLSRHQIAQKPPILVIKFHQFVFTFFRKISWWNHFLFNFQKKKKKKKKKTCLNKTILFILNFQMQY